MKGTLEIIKDENLYSRKNGNLLHVFMLFKYEDMLFKIEMYNLDTYGYNEAGVYGKIIRSVADINRMENEFTRYTNAESTYESPCKFKITEYMDCIKDYCEMIDRGEVILDFPKRPKPKQPTILEEIEKLVDFSEIEWALLINTSTHNSMLLKKNYSSQECEQYKEFLNHIYTESSVTGYLLWRGHFVLKDGDYLSVDKWVTDCDSSYYWRKYSYPKYPEI